MNLPKMKPCPFCGSEVDVNDEDAVYREFRDKSIYTAGCYNYECGARVLGYSPEHAISNWNKRTEYKDPAIEKQQKECNHEWISENFDCFGFAHGRYCDKCDKKEDL